MTRAPPSPLRLALGGLLAMAAGIGIGRFVYTPILPAMIADLGLSAGAAGRIAAANYVGYLVGVIVLSLPGVPGSRRTWLLCGLAASVVTTAAVGLATDTTALAAIRLASGVATAVVFVYAISLVLERLNLLGRPGLSAVHFAGIGTGILVSSAAVTLTEASGLGWREMWFVSGGLAAVAAAAVAWLVPEASSVAPIAAAPPRRAPRQPGALVRMIVAYGLLGFGYIIGATFIVTIVRTDPGSRSLEHWVWPIAGLAALPSVAVWNAVARRIGLFRAYALGNLVQGVGILLGLLPIGPIGPILSAATLGGTFVALTSLGIVGARNLSHVDPRRIVAGITISFGIGQILGPIVAGTLVDLTGSFRSISAVSVALLVTGALLTVTIRDPRAPA